MCIVVKCFKTYEFYCNDAVLLVHNVSSFVDA